MATAASFFDGLSHRALCVARRGALEHALDHPALLVEDDTGRLVAVLTYVIRGADCEILTLHSDRQWNGVGTALLAEVKLIARAAGCTRLWLVTTNDNVDALRFYQRRGFRLAALRPGAVDGNRARLKPEIPELGAHGIALRDELELEQAIEHDVILGARTAASSSSPRAEGSSSACAAARPGPPAGPGAAACRG